nr:Nucleosomal histone H3-Lys79 methylase [Polyrhizophydium stewartii]
MDPSLGSAVEVRKKKKAKARKDHRYLSKQALQPAIHAVDVVRKNPKPYAHVGDESNRIGDDIQTIELEYPGHNAQEIFPLVVPSKTTQIEYNPINDIYVTTQMIARHCLSEQQMPLLGDSRSGIVRRIIKACHRKDSVALQSAVSDFNQVVTQLKDEGAFEQDEIRGPPAQYELITHILEQAYARSVAPLAHLLNNYEGFSNNVYGEIKHSFVQDLIKNAEIQPHHIFLDMGSGIGNVILQVSAQCLCESYGIEIMEIPSQLAKKQKAEFLSRMRYYAKPCGRIVVKQGDFLEDPEIHEVISRADVIFVNNYAFDAALNQGILAKFLDLKDSAKVISLRSFVPVDRRPSLRRSNAIESIFTVKEYHYARDSVSWMVEGGKYYIHTVDRSQLADFA